jgi:CBS domain containing-hemolysin-like protein
MVPSQGIRVFDLRKSLEENIRNAGEKIHRSYPVTADGSLATIQGYVRVRDLFVSNLLGPQENDWRTLIRPVLNISDQASLTQLLAAFLENREIAAIVNSNKASNIGWITLDDVTETLMGARG